MRHPTGQPRPARRPWWRPIATATVLAAVVATVACSGGSGAGDRGEGDRGDGGAGATPTTEEVSDMDDLELATTAYVAGYPLVVTGGAGGRPVLVTAADGSLEITLAHDDPGPGTNWLPVPDGPFVLMLRLYLPGRPVVDGSYDYPDVERVDAA